MINLANATAHIQRLVETTTNGVTSRVWVALSSLAAWNVATAYAKDAMVQHLGLAWRAKKANTGATPAEDANWTLVGSTLTKKGTLAILNTTKQLALGAKQYSVSERFICDACDIRKGDKLTISSVEYDVLFPVDPMHLGHHFEIDLVRITP